MKYYGEFDVDKYYGKRKYRDVRRAITKIEYSDEEKLEMLMDICKYVEDKDFKLYHDLMDDICESHTDWFNMISFDKKNRAFLLDFIKSKVQTHNKTSKK